MKRLPMMTIIIAAALTCAFFGANSFIARASSSFTAEIYHSNPNYYFLSNPKMITTDGNNAFVINEKTANDKELLVFNTSSDLVLPIPSKTLALEFELEYIKHAGGLIFLFERNGFTAISYSNDNFTSFTMSKIFYFDEYINYNFFDVCFVSGPNPYYRVFFASETHYGWNDYQLVANNSAIDSDPSSSHAPTKFTRFTNEKITAIASDESRFLYICVSEEITFGNTSPEYDCYIYQLNQTNYTSAPVNKRYLSQFTSFSAVPDRNLFVYINQSGSLTLFNRDSDEFSVQLDTDNSSVFNTKASRKPIFATTEGQNYVYVIDEEKRSVDRYVISQDGSSLLYDKTIAGHRGGDSGFFNRPTSMTLINSSKRSSQQTTSEYLVTDRAGQIVYNYLDNDSNVTSKNFFTDTSIRLSDNARATYDNFDTVYIYDYDSVRQINRIRTFTLSGESRDHEFTGFGRQISDMFADSNRTIYVLDASNNKIYYYSPSTMAETAEMALLPAYETAKGADLFLPLYTITQSTHGIYNEQLDAIVITSIETSDKSIKTLVLPLDGSSPQILETLLVITDKFIIDITTDAFGNIILLFSQNDKYYLSQFELCQDGNFNPLPKWEHEINNTTVDHANSSLSIDHINRRIFYIGSHHAIESFELSNADIWSPLGQSPDESWKDNTIALNAFNPAASDSTPIFAKATADIVIYQYQGSIRALAVAPKNSIFKVLNFSDNYILYENAGTGEYIIGFVSKKFITNTEPYTYPKFISARVMFNHTQVLKYPTTDKRNFTSSESLTLLTLEKNYEQDIDISGLQISRMVAVMDEYDNPSPVTDVHCFSFYEIRLAKNTNGTYSPDPEGTFVGYIKTNNVIDYFLEPSIERFLPNATIKILPSHNITHVQVFERTETGNFIELENETITNKQAIQISGRFNKNQEYTYVYYYDAALGRARGGWIETAYIAPNGLSAIQLIAIAALILVLLCGVMFVIIRIRKRF